MDEKNVVVPRHALLPYLRCSCSRGLLALLFRHEHDEHDPLSANASTTHSQLYTCFFWFPIFKNANGFEKVRDWNHSSIRSTINRGPLRPTTAIGSTENRGWRKGRDVRGSLTRSFLSPCRCRIGVSREVRIRRLAMRSPGRSGPRARFSRLLGGIQIETVSRGWQKQVSGRLQKTCSRSEEVTWSPLDCIRRNSLCGQGLAFLGPFRRARKGGGAVCLKNLKIDKNDSSPAISNRGGSSSVWGLG